MLISRAIGRAPRVDVDHRMAGGVGEVEIVVHLDTFGIAWTMSLNAADGALFLSRSAARCPTAGSRPATGPSGSSQSWRVPVSQARPAMLGTMAGRPAIDVSASIRQSKREPMIETPRKASPTLQPPRACRTAMRAEQPVPVGERSILPGRTTTALRPVATPSTRLDRRGDLAEADMVPVGVLGMAKAELLVGRAGDPHAGLGQIARLVRARCAKPSAAASTMTKLSPP